MRTIIAVFIILIVLTAAGISSDLRASADLVMEDSWVSKEPMSQPRAGLGVVAVNGKIYAIGGASTAQKQSENLLSINEEYDPATDTWTIKPSMPTPRAYFAIAAYQNKIYCIGGVVGSEKFFDGFWTHSLFVYSGITEVYDTITETWQTKHPYPSIRLILQNSKPTWSMEKSTP